MIKKYINNINFPIISNLEELSSLMKIESKIVIQIIASPNNFYNTFEIKKRNGGYRDIVSPHSILKYIQRWILINILNNFNLHHAATGFRLNKGLVDNVTPHLGNKLLLKIDLKDFFHSIRIKKVFNVFVNCGYSMKISYILSLLCTKENILPQGAPTSPALSNIIAKNMDIQLSNLATQFKLNYTRYADDIGISGSYIPEEFIKQVKIIIYNEGFIINDKKTKIISSGKKILTGISINSSIPKLPRETKRILRAMAYKLLNTSYEDYKNKIFQNDPIFLQRLIGKYCFWNYVEKENNYVIETLRKLKEYASQLSI